MPTSDFICTLFCLLSVPLFPASEMEALPAAFSLIEPKEMKDLPLPQNSYTLYERGL